MDESKILKCIWLNCVCEHSPKLIHDCVSHIGTAEEIYNGNFPISYINMLAEISDRWIKQNEIK